MMEDGNDNSNDINFSEEIPLDPPAPLEPSPNLPFSHMLRQIIDEYDNNNLQRVEEFLAAYINGGRMGRQRMESDGLPTPHQMEDSEDSDDSQQTPIEWLNTDTADFYVQALQAAYTANHGGGTNALIYLFRMFLQHSHMMEEICRDLARKGNIDAVIRLSQDYGEHSVLILNAALLGATAANNTDAMQQLINLGGDPRIAEIGRWNGNGEVTLLHTMTQVRAALAQGLPRVAALWLDRYFEDCRFWANLNINIMDDDVPPQRNDPNEYLNHIRGEINRIRALSGQRNNQDNAIHFLCDALIAVQHSGDQEVIEGLCLILSLVLETGVELPKLWTALVNAQAYNTLLTLHDRMSNRQHMDRIWNTCLVAAVYSRNIPVVNFVLYHGASVIIMRNGQLPNDGGPFDPQFHMPLISLCLDGDLVGVNLQTALVLMAYGCPAYYGDETGGRSCVSHAIRLHDWLSVERLCFLGISCTNHIENCITINDLHQYLPTSSQAVGVLSAIYEVFLLLCRLPSNLRNLLWQHYYMPTFNVPQMYNRLIDLYVNQPDRNLAFTILTVLMLSPQNFGPIHQEMHRGLSITPPFPLYHDDVLLFTAALNAPNRPSLREVLAWLRLYEMNDPNVMSRDSLRNLIIRRYLNNNDSTDDSN